MLLFYFKQRVAKDFIFLFYSVLCSKSGASFLRATFSWGELSFGRVVLFSSEYSIKLMDLYKTLFYS